MSHPFDPRHAARLDDPARARSQPVDGVLALLSLTGAETVVDYGAGTGYLTLPLAAALPHGRVVAVDRSAEMLAELRRRLEARRAAGGDALAPVELVHTADNRVPLADGAADAVAAVNLWHEISDDQAALDELLRLLAPRGTLLIVDWDEGATARPNGPWPPHALTLEQALEVVAAVGLAVGLALPAGEPFPYHFTIVARHATGVAP